MRAFVDRLLERGWIDRWGFLGFSFGGSLLIILAKVLAISSLAVAAGAAGAIVIYALIVQRSGTGRLRGDQAGDNCYYLGLIFTLVSLAYAIFTFDPINTATTIVQGFGVALATTIVGLVLRVFFNQTRADVVEVEDTARLELAEAAGRLRSELSQAVVSMNDFGRQTRQSLEELQAEVTETLKEVRTETATIVKAQADDAVARSKKLLSATERVVGGFERSAESFDRIQASHIAFAESLTSIQQAADATKSTLVQLANQALELSTAQRDLGQTVSTVREVATSVLAQVQAFDGAADQFGQNIRTHLEAVRTLPDDIVDKAVNGVEGAIGRLEVGLRAFSERQEAMAGESLSAVERHNAAMEAELAKSRDMVGKVHGSLVDMTGRLVDQIEDRRP